MILHFCAKLNQGYFNFWLSLTRLYDVKLHVGILRFCVGHDFFQIWWLLKERFCCYLHRAMSTKVAMLDDDRIIIG